MTFTPHQSELSCWAIIPAAGIGSRMQSETPKQYLDINNQKMIEYSIELFIQTPWIKGIVIALSEEDSHWQTLSFSNTDKVKTVIGGKERFDSVYQAALLIQKIIEQQSAHDDFILVHDAARPCLTHEDMNKLRSQAFESEFGLLLADQVSDTVKRENENGGVLKTVPRSGLWRALTPQMFPQKLLLNALENELKVMSGSITDEASAVEALGYAPRLVQGRKDNIKVTTPGDVQLASLILKAQALEMDN